jgi:hypothetical protein
MRVGETSDLPLSLTAASLCLRLDPSVDTGLDFPRRCPGGGRVPGSRDGLQAPSSFMIQVSTKGERQGFEKGVTTGSRPTYVLMRVLVLDLVAGASSRSGVRLLPRVRPDVHLYAMRAELGYTGSFKQPILRIVNMFSICTTDISQSDSQSTTDV